MSEDKTTTIRVKESTKSLLEKKGRFGESFDDLIVRLLRELDLFREEELLRKR